mmetsp:Transcript_67421/g.140875  ORF Transcript_67421/g.140875 Transcript_67421/m.140875 type:complete len:216 (+) Transcript_67421:1176-1823(+)
MTLSSSSTFRRQTRSSRVTRKSLKTRTSVKFVPSLSSFDKATTAISTRPNTTKVASMKFQPRSFPNQNSCQPANQIFMRRSSVKMMAKAASATSQPLQSACKSSEMPTSNAFKTIKPPMTVSSTNNFTCRSDQKLSKNRLIDHDLLALLSWLWPSKILSTWSSLVAFRPLDFWWLVLCSGPSFDDWEEQSAYMMETRLSTIDPAEPLGSEGEPSI